VAVARDSGILCIPTRAKFIMNKTSIWVALYNVTQTTSIDTALSMIEQNPGLRAKLDKLAGAKAWNTLKGQRDNREQANRLLEIAQEWSGFSKAEQKERLDEISELFCYSTETTTVAEAIAHLDSHDEWDDFIDMINDPEVFEQDGEPTNKEDMLELVEVAFGTGLSG
jgi:Cft2 family RNA processing exonuclease